jgi:hypothetical protein
MWIAPLVLLSLMQFAQGILLRDLALENMRAKIERSELVPEDQKESILRDLQPGADPPGKVVGQTLFGVATFWVIGFLVPAVLFLVGLNFVLGARASFRPVFTVAAFSGLVLLVRELLRTPIMLARDTVHVHTSPAAFLSEPSAAALAALGSFDVFELYRMVVLTFGLSAVSGVAPRRAAVPVVGVWLLYLLATVGCALSPLGQFMP